MKMPGPRLVRYLAACLICITAPLQARAAAITIDYQLTSLATPSRYEYLYSLTNDSLASPLSWFSIDFDTALYDESSLVISTVGLGDWSQLMLASVPGLPAQYDAYNTAGTGLAVGSSLTGFKVEFTWLGAGTPGSQAFTVWDPGTLDILDTGITTASVAPPPPTALPEPGTALLALLALGTAWAVSRRMPRPAPAARSAA